MHRLAQCTEIKKKTLKFTHLHISQSQKQNLQISIGIDSFKPHEAIKKQTICCTTDQNSHLKFSLENCGIIS